MGLLRSTKCAQDWSKADGKYQIFDADEVDQEAGGVAEQRETEKEIERVQAELTALQDSKDADADKHMFDLQTSLDGLKSKRSKGNVISRFMFEVAKVFSHLRSVSHWCHGKRFQDWVQLPAQRTKFKDIWSALAAHVGSRHHILYQNAVVIYLMWEAYKEYILTMVPIPRIKLIESVLEGLNDHI